MTATNVEKLVEHSWHHLSVEKVARLLETDLEIGLSSELRSRKQLRKGARFIRICCGRSPSSCP
ncbi:hypothetical protein [Microcoleus sp. D3_18a_C4]|uniref:hypothetical protein n=1 Tax=unclassified Microcoleus TaxID=2642155 RepID=UPI002FD29DBB